MQTACRGQAPWLSRNPKWPASRGAGRAVRLFKLAKISPQAHLPASGCRGCVFFIRRAGIDVGDRHRSSYAVPQRAPTVQAAICRRGASGGAVLASSPTGACEYLAIWRRQRAAARDRPKGKFFAGFSGNAPGPMAAGRGRARAQRVAPPGLALLAAALAERGLEGRLLAGLLPLLRGQGLHRQGVYSAF